jgi:hypothetical protein
VGWNDVEASLRHQCNAGCAPSTIVHQPATKRHVGHETMDEAMITLMLHEITGILWPYPSSSSDSMIEEDVEEEGDLEEEEEVE